VRIKDFDEIDLPGLKDLEGLSKYISQKFSNFFNSYAKAINKQENRMGSLFQKNFKRIKVDNENYLMTLLYYIHANPQMHYVQNDFRTWPYSSYRHILYMNRKNLSYREVINWFGHLGKYKEYHSTLRDLSQIKYAIE
jgi:hypothetical protein